MKFSFRAALAAVFSVLFAVPVVLIGQSPAMASEAPPPASGPAIDVDLVAAFTALSCPDGLTHPDRPVVLLVHGTATSATESWPWGFGAVLPTAGFDWCTVQLPDRAMTDIQISSQYVVVAVRTLHAFTHRQVDLIGHSQGGVQVRWAVRWWPDVRADVDDVVTLAGSNRGSGLADALCNPDCAPALWQQRQGSSLINALNRVWTPPGPSYSAIYSSTDEVQVPASVASFEGASNIVVQDLCLGRSVTHIQALDDAVYVGMALDAIENAGPADPKRFDAGLCADTVFPGINQIVATAAEASGTSNAVATITTHPHVANEPELRPYARAK